MVVTTAETLLAGALVTLVAAGGGVWVGAKNKVSKTQCSDKHVALEKLLAARLDPIKESLDEIKTTVKEMNGKARS